MTGDQVESGSPSPVMPEVSRQSTGNPVPSGFGLSKLRQWAVHSPTIRWIALSLALASIPLSLALSWYCFFHIIPSIASWGWGGSTYLLSGIAALFGILLVGTFAIYPPIGAVIFLIWVVGIVYDASQVVVNQTMVEGSRRQQSAEDDLMQTEQAALVGLVRYSRVQLESYYRMGLDQTQRSFAYSVMAMWLGFLVILTAVIPRIFDLSRYGISAPDTNVSVVAVLAGVIIEIISALFLWMYTSSVRNLKYFYDRQMFYHTVLISRTIARDLQNPDDVVKLIIERTMSREWELDIPKLPRGVRTRGRSSAEPNGKSP